MLELTFHVGENRIRITTRRLSSPLLFNEIMLGIKVIREFSRRARELDFAVLKAQEMRNILIFFFPVVIQCIEPEAKERRIWLLLVFMIRSCIIPETEYEEIDDAQVVNASRQFYNLFAKTFSNKNCTYSVHVLSSHLPMMRAQGPLTSTSAFIFENFYGEMRSCFRPGTVSSLKQIMQRVYLKRLLTYHSCEKTMYLSPKETALENNSLVYVYSNNVYHIYKIVNIEKENPNILFCRVQGKIDIEFSDAKDIEWRKVGVFKEGAIGHEIVQVERNRVHGKVLRVCSLLITCPRNVLNEK